MLPTKLKSVSRLFVLCFYFTFLYFTLSAQNPYFINYQLADGLPSNSVYSLIQDSKGFIWIATDLGISRFDGSNFKNFSTKDGLPDNEIFTFFEDSKERIWFHTFNGEVSFYEDGKFYNPDNHPNLWKAKTGNFINHITEDAQKNIFLSFYTEYGYLKLTEGQSPEWVHTKDRELSNEFMFFGTDGELYFITDKGVFTYDHQEKIDFQKLNLLTSIGTTRGFETTEYVFIGKGKDILIIDKKEVAPINSIKLKEIETDIINIRYYKGKLFAGTRDGVYEITPISSDFKEYSIQKYLSGYIVSSTLVDREFNLWFSTFEAGIFFSPANGSQHWTEESGLRNKQVLTIDKDQKGNLWMGHPEYQYSIWNDKRMTSYQLDDPNPLNIQGTVHFAPNEHWVLGQRQIMLHDNINPKYFFVAVDDLLKDQYGQYWIGHNNLFRLSQKELFSNLLEKGAPNFEMEVRSRSNYFVNIEPIDRRRFTCLAGNNRDRIWAGSTNGLNCYFYDSTEVIDQYEIASVKGKISTLIYDQSKDHLWVGNSTDGVFLLQKDSVLHTIDESYNLSSNFITALHLDEKSNLWIGTSKGIDRLFWVNDSLHLECFTREHGLFNIRVNDLTSKDDELYIATDEGVIILPFQLPPLDKHPPVQLTEVKVNEQLVNLHNLEALAYDKNDIQFLFSAPSFRDQGHLSYQYRLIGDHSEWLRTNSEEARYSSLSPGKYTFEVRAVNELGLKSHSPESLAIIIQSPFWQKAWFLLLSAAILLGIIILLVQRQIRRLRKKHELQQQFSTLRNDRLEMEKQLLDLEMRALRIQMNPHFMFNALNTIKGYYAQNKVQEANAYISKFARLLRMILKNDKKYILLEEEINIIEFYIDLVRIRYDNKFDYLIKVDPTIDPKEIILPSMLLQPMVENAIIHGLAPLNSKGHIEISFEAEGQFLISRISDNGIGRKASARFNKHKMHESKGIEINRARLAIINKDHEVNDYFKIHDLRYADGSPAGTEVIIKTPIKKRW